MSQQHLEGEDVRHVTNDVLGKSPALMTEAERITAALHIATIYSGIDGSHHKMWTIDQIVRVLTGSPLEKSPVRIDSRGNSYTYDFLGESDAYSAFVTNYCDGEDGPDTYSWDAGIAP